MQRRDVGDHGHHGVKVLVETTDEALASSDFRRYRDAGLDVTVCSAPVGDERCPLVEGDGCAPAGQADVVLFGLGVGGCTVLPFPSSIDEQIRVLRRAACRFEHPSRIG